jgi:hypothetical protein
LSTSVAQLVGGVAGRWSSAAEPAADQVVGSGSVVVGSVVTGSVVTGSVVGGGVGWVRVWVVVVVGTVVSGSVIVVMPCGPLVVVIVTCFLVVVTVPGEVVLPAVVGTEVGPVVGSRATEEFVPVLRPSPADGTFGPGPVDGLAVVVVAVRVATVARTVASATPEPARMTSARDLARLSAGGAMWPRSVGSVTVSPWRILATRYTNGVQSALSDVDHRPKSWVQSQPFVARPMPMAT